MYIQWKLIYINKATVRGKEIFVFVYIIKKVLIISLFKVTYPETFREKKSNSQEEIGLKNYLYITREF
jgi:hypothetical protein